MAKLDKFFSDARINRGAEETEVQVTDEELAKRAQYVEDANGSGSSYTYIDAQAELIFTLWGALEQARANIVPIEKKPMAPEEMLAKAAVYREVANTLSAGFRIDQDRLWKPAEMKYWVDWYNDEAERLGG